MSRIELTRSRCRQVSGWPSEREFLVEFEFLTAEPQGQRSPARSFKADIGKSIGMLEIWSPLRGAIDDLLKVARSCGWTRCTTESTVGSTERSYSIIGDSRIQKRKCAVRQSVPVMRWKEIECGL